MFQMLYLCHQQIETNADEKESSLDPTKCKLKQNSFRESNLDYKMLQRQEVNHMIKTLGCHDNKRIRQAAAQCD